MDAKIEVGIILNTLFIHQMKQYQLKRELRDFDGDKNIELVKQFYSELIRLSARTLRKITALKLSEKCFDRPFFFKQNRYDVQDGHLHKEMKILRDKIIKTLPSLAKNQELSFILLPTGNVGQVLK